MKTKLQFKYLAILLLLPALVFANGDKLKGKYTKEKTINKEYVVNANAGLEVGNSYGNVDIVSWNENRTVITVHIKTNGNNEEKVQKRLDEITVEFTGTASMVTAKTKFKKGGSSGWFGKKNNNVHMEINYTIKMPITNSANIKNSYGAINLNKLEGNAKISCDYGQLTIGELMADNNLISFDYTKNSSIGYMKSGKIDADYSSFTLDKVGNLELSADYTNAEILTAADVNYNCDYGKVIINNANSITGQGDYVNNKFGKVSGSLDLNTQHGSILVERLTGDAKNVDIQAEYTGIKLGFDSNYHFDFSLDLAHASFNGADNVTVMKSDKTDSKRVYSGYHGNKNSGNKINIKSEYGGVTFNKH
jgi:hypothetical protein